MIYFLDNSLQLQKIVTSKNVISAIHEHELNGLIRADVELDLSYANKFLVLGIDHVGYYYKDEFYLHKIQRVEYDHVNESAKVVLRHIFFEDMIFGKLIQDVRPQNQDALTVSRQTIDANTRWQTIMTDVTGRLSTNFYWQVPYEVIEFMTENYRIEYLPKILFDGQNINGFQLHLANKIGEDKNIRIPYGSRVLDLKYEEDYSEIITKLVVHGKGEEVGDGYGRRINISDVNFSRNGVESPVGSLYLEDETITNTYGNDGQTPREGREVFEDIEDVSELAEAGYQHYLQVSRPQMLFTADVADIGDVGIGDSVMIIRREYDVYFKARIHKLSVDLLYPEDAQVELGDYEHFKESKIARKSREKNNRVQGQLSDRITRLKREADERFNNEVAQWKSEYEQALIDVHAEIEADRVNMTNLIEGTRTEFTDNLNAEITQTKEYAEQQAQAKADSVQTNLDSFKDSHQQLYDEVTGNILDIDTFLGDKSKTLAKQFEGLELGLNQSITAESGRIDALVTETDGYESTISQLLIDVEGITTTVAEMNGDIVTGFSELNQTLDGFTQTVGQMEHDLDYGLSTINQKYDSISSRVANIKLNTRNLIRGTDFENPEMFQLIGNSTVRDINGQKSVRLAYQEGLNTASVIFMEYIHLKANEDYFLVVDHRSYSTDEFDYLQLQLEDGSYTTLKDADSGEEGFTNIPTTGTDWHQSVIRIRLTEPLSGRLRIGTRHNRGTTSTGFIDIRNLYLTNTLNREWVPHPRDGQNIDSLVERVSDIEQTADEIRLSVSDSTGLASVLSISSTAMDIISENLNLTGNMNVRGQIESISVSAVRGDIAYLKTNILTANVITSDHIQVGTALVDKMFATSARIDELITKTHFVNEMHALTLNVVDLNASQIRTRLLSANTIEAEWLKGGTALIDRIFSSNAMFNRMMAKSGFVTALNTVTIDTDQLTIRRPDGVAWVSQGLARGHVPVQIFDNYADSSVQFSGLNFVTSSSFWKNFKYFYTPHEGSRLRVVWAVSLQTGNSASEYIEVGVNGFGNYNPISNGTGSSTRRQLVYAGQTEYITQDIPLPPPNFQTFQANLQFRRSPTGVHLDNRVTVRILHIGQYD